MIEEEEIDDKKDYVIDANPDAEINELYLNKMADEYEPEDYKPI